MNIKNSLWILNFSSLINKTDPLTPVINLPLQTTVFTIQTLPQCFLHESFYRTSGFSETWRTFTYLKKLHFARESIKLFTFKITFSFKFTFFIFFFCSQLWKQILQICVQSSATNFYACWCKTFFVYFSFIH